MGKLLESIILVHATSHAIRAKRTLEKHGIKGKLVPVPRHISSQCGVCIRFNKPDTQRVIDILGSAGIDTDGIHDLD